MINLIVKSSLGKHFEYLVHVFFEALFEYTVRFVDNQHQQALEVESSGIAEVINKTTGCCHYYIHTCLSVRA